MATESLETKVIRSREKGLSQRDIAKLHGTNLTKVQRILAKADTPEALQKKIKTKTKQNSELNPKQVDELVIMKSDDPNGKLTPLLMTLRKSLDDLDKYVILWEVKLCQFCREKRYMDMMSAQARYQDAIMKRIQIVLKIYEILSKDTQHPIEQVSGSTVKVNVPVYPVETFDAKHLAETTERSMTSGQ